jgi:hypothetical protein
LPLRAVRAERPMRVGIAFVGLREDGHVLLRRRPEAGLLGGMLEVPSTAWDDLLPPALRAAPSGPIGWSPARPTPPRTSAGSSLSRAVGADATLTFCGLTAAAAARRDSTQRCRAARKGHRPRPQGALSPRLCRAGLRVVSGGQSDRRGTRGTSLGSDPRQDRCASAARRNPPSCLSPSPLMHDGSFCPVHADREAFGREPKGSAPAYWLPSASRA